nr:hypothetical protein RAR13_19635 [Aminobacter aminovorans]
MAPRVKVGGGAGGHNGVRSIDQQIAKDYRRVRMASARSCTAMCSATSPSPTRNGWRYCSTSWPTAPTF